MLPGHFFRWETAPCDCAHLSGPNEMSRVNCNAAHRPFSTGCLFVTTNEENNVLWGGLTHTLIRQPTRCGVSAMAAHTHTARSLDGMCGRQNAHCCFICFQLPALCCYTCYDINLPLINAHMPISKFCQYATPLPDHASSLSAAR